MEKIQQSFYPSILISAKPNNIMKAVSVVMEYVLLFMFGIIIFISSISVFGNYDAYFNYVSVNDQLNGISEYLAQI